MMSSTSEHTRCDHPFFYNTSYSKNSTGICTRPKDHAGKHCSSYIDGWSDMDTASNSLPGAPMHIMTSYEDGERREIAVEIANYGGA